MDGMCCFIDRERCSTLSKEEVVNLMERIKDGDSKARNEFVERNINLVVYLVNRSFKVSLEEKKDLVSIGCIGLIKAVNNFDVSKNIKFATYATTCILNEINMSFRYNKGVNLECSYESTYCQDNDGNTLTVLDTLADENKNTVEDYEKKEAMEFIRKAVANLEPDERKMVELYFGFYDQERLDQGKLAKKFHLSQSYISRKIRNSLKKIEKNLIKEKIIEKRDTQSYQTLKLVKNE